MKTLKLKTTCHAMDVNYSLANPAAPIGAVGMVRTIEITDIPEGIADHAVLSAWRRTADASYLGTPDLKHPRHTYKFSEIGNGKIIR